MKSVRGTIFFSLAVALVITCGYLNLSCSNGGGGSDGGVFLTEPPPADDGGDDNGNGEEPKVAMCHVPPGNPAHAHTIWVAESAVSALLELGDGLGPCAGDAGDPGSGNLVEICHVHGRDHAHTIRVAESAVAAHLRDGDTLGPCPEEN